MTNVKLSKRLQVIADMVENGSSTIDVGCDHALLDIYLVQTKKVKNSIASDITQGALNQAIKNISYYGLNNKISTRLGDGLETIKKDDNINTVILSGLGDQKITNILSSDKLSNIDTLIIQSNIGIINIRKNLTKLGYYIKEEKQVKENGIIYTVIKFQKGRKKYTNKQYLLGPILLVNKDELFIEDVKNKIVKNMNILKNIPKRRMFRILKLKKYIKILKKEI